MSKRDQSHDKGSGKRQELREKQRKTQARNTILIIGGIALAAIAVVLVIIWPSLQPVGDIKVPTLSTKPQANGLSMGDPNAPVKIVEFADFQCPACGYYVSSLEPQVIKDYIETGKVYFTYHPFSFIGEESYKAAEAAYCANDQGKFWEYHDILYANQTQENGGDFAARRLTAFAEKIGLNVNTFNSCYNSGKYTAQVNTDATDAKNQSVNSTPTFDVNGTKVEFKNLIETIDTALGAVK
jgi:protein-disulfide isomerase